MAEHKKPKKVDKKVDKESNKRSANSSKTPKTGIGGTFRTKSGHRLTPQQERFCELFASDKEFYGNGVQSYLEAYNVDTSKPGWYNTAKAGAHENLTKPYLLERITEILEAGNLNDQFVDKQLAFLITQDADFSAKMKAIQEYNKLKARITERRDITSGGEKIAPVALVEFLDAAESESTTAE